MKTINRYIGSSVWDNVGLEIWREIWFDDWLDVKEGLWDGMEGEVFRNTYTPIYNTIKRQS